MVKYRWGPGSLTQKARPANPPQMPRCLEALQWNIIWLLLLYIFLWLDYDCLFTSQLKRTMLFFTFFKKCLLRWQFIWQRLSGQHFNQYCQTSPFICWGFQVSIFSLFTSCNIVTIAATLSKSPFIKCYGHSIFRYTVHQTPRIYNDCNSISPIANILNVHTNEHSNAG